MIKNTISLMLVVFLTFSLSSCGKNNTDIDEYETYIEVVSGSNTFMPDLDTLEEYQELNVYQFSRVHRTINLVITYDEITYSEIKDDLNLYHVFLSEPIYWNDVPQIPEVEISHNGFEIKVVEDSEFDYPSRFGMIGYNDETHQICYLFFSDDSRNQISSMERLIEESFKFNN